jgi:hypothetical protein
MTHRRHLARFVSAVVSPLVAVVLAVGAVAPGCAINTLGRGPDDIDLKNDGSDEAQAALYRNYEVVYERGMLRRPGADPVAVAADIHVRSVDDVSSPAWSDAAYNYLSVSDDAAEVLEHPSVAFDEFAHSGNGELVIIGVGAGTGLIGGAIAWFVPTTVRDGLSAEETNQLALDASAGLMAGFGLGVVVAAAYTYIVPAVTTPMAASQYRAAVRAFNDDLDERIAGGGPAAAAGAKDHDESDCADCPSGKCPTEANGKPCCCDGNKCDLEHGVCNCGDACACAECPVHGAQGGAAVAPSASAAPAEAPRPVEAPSSPAAPTAPR